MLILKNNTALFRSRGLIISNLVLLSLFINSCLDEPVRPHIIISTKPISNITSISATTGGIVLDNGGSQVTTRGVVWSTNPAPTTILSTQTSDQISTGSWDSGTGTFESILTSLTPGTKYYVRAYAINSSGTTYGDEVEFVTLPHRLPVISSSIYAFYETNALAGGNISDEGGSPVTERGLAWDTKSSPTMLLSTKTSNGNGSGSFRAELKDLLPSTKYYMRAYATNSFGTSYGQEESFTTLPANVPAGIKIYIKSIGSLTSICDGEITNDRGSSITAKGVVWDKATSPDIFLSTKTVDGTGTGAFSSMLTDLSPSTRYYLRAYATNSLGIAYGDEKSFVTPAANMLTVTTNDIDVVYFCVQLPWSPGPGSCGYMIGGIPGGNIPDDGGSIVTERGLEWRNEPNSFSTVGQTSDGSGAGAFTSDIASKLTTGTAYYVRAYATNSFGTSYGQNEYIYIPKN